MFRFSYIVCVLFCKKILKLWQTLQNTLLVDDESESATSKLAIKDNLRLLPDDITL